MYEERSCGDRMLCKNLTDGKSFAVGGSHDYRLLGCGSECARLRFCSRGDGQLHVLGGEHPETSGVHSEGLSNLIQLQNSFCVGSVRPM